MSYLRLGIAVGVLLALIGAFFYGTSVGKAKCQNAYAAAAAKAAKKADGNLETAQQNDAAAVEAEIQRETVVREIVREVPKIIDRPVYRNVCVDADGVQLIRRAVDTANSGSATSGPDGDAPDVR